MKQLECDVAVIAAGTAGVTAALTAAEKGAHVIVLEKSATIGGTGNIALGVFAAESRLQRKQLIPLTREEAFKIHMDYTHWRVDARLVSEYINRSADTIDWLEKLGVQFEDPSTYFMGSNYTQHAIKRGESAPPLMKTLAGKAEELGVQFLMKTAARKIIKDKGRIIGIQTENTSNGKLMIGSKAVIVATGGFSDNPEWVKKYTGFEYKKDLFPVMARGLMGDGIRMAWEMGAGREGLNMQLIYLIPEAERFRELQTAFHQPHLVVNLSGERFVNEEILANTTFTGNALARQKNHCAFSIFDETTKKELQEKGVDYPHGPVYPTNLDAEIDQAINQGHKHIFTADSLDELAVKTGIAPEGFMNTVTEYNRVCKTGRDRIFHKNSRYLRPVESPKFYAGRIYPCAYGSLGGIKINYKTEVLTEEHEVIPGLYAAGVDANSIYGDSYLILLPGNTMGFALNSGRIAGENAAQYAKSIIK